MSGRGLGAAPTARPVGRSVGRSVGRVVLAGTAAAVTTRAVRAALGAGTDPADPRWTRTNHRGEPVSLLAGPAVAGGLLAGIAAGIAPGVAGSTASPSRARAALAAGVAVTGGAVLGLVDDLSEDQERRRKGLRGHLGALARGELTTGGMKVVGIGLTSLAAAALATSPGSTAGAGGRVGGSARAFDVATSGALIAASANLLNLFDLRPGRALKVGLIGAPATLAAAWARSGAVPGGVGAGRGAAGNTTSRATSATAVCLSAAAVGAAGAALGPDLAERDMLGDGGANALGAAIGAAAAFGCSRPVRLALLAGVMGLTLASERISFTGVIERTPVLRRVDGWGRRPVDDDEGATAEDVTTGRAAASGPATADELTGSLLPAREDPPR